MEIRKEADVRSERVFEDCADWKVVGEGSGVERRVREPLCERLRAVVLET